MSDHMAQKADDQIQAGLNERDELYAKIDRMEDTLVEVTRHCLCGRSMKGFDYHEEHPKLGMPKPGARWLTPTDLVKTRHTELFSRKETTK